MTESLPRESQSPQKKKDSFHSGLVAQSIQTTSVGDLSGQPSSSDATGAFDNTQLIQDAWSNTLAKLREEVSTPVYDAYLSPLQYTSFTPESLEVVITAPSTLVRNHIESTFGVRIREMLAQELGFASLNLRFEIAPSSHSPKATYVVVKKTGKAEAVQTENIPLHHTSPVFTASNINPKYTFANFVVGNSNQFCHAAAQQVADQPGLSYNPLFIYGGVGLGKTHLLHAIGNKILERNSKAKILYMSSEAFTNELIQALRNSKMDEFKNKMRSIEVLLIDDIQFMVGKERTQEEFFHTFNALYSAKHQIVITSDKIPSDIPQIEERLYTRFSWGLIADIQSPDFETRVAILKRKATNENFTLDEDVAHLIAEKVSSNVRELEGALTRLHAISSLQNVPITKELAVSGLKHLFQPKKINISVDDIKKAVASHFGLKVSEIISKRRTKNLSFPRHIAMYLCRKHTTCSYPEIGAHFGGRDHSSVIHAASVVTTKIKNDTQVKSQVGEIEKALLSS